MSHEPPKCGGSVIRLSSAVNPSIQPSVVASVQPPATLATTRCSAHTTLNPQPRNAGKIEISCQNAAPMTKLRELG